MTSYALLDEYTPVEFEGLCIAEVSTERPDSLRWLEMEIYRITAGENAGRYVIHTCGRSVVYHVHGSTCNLGAVIEAGRLDATLYEPCENCRPPLLTDLDPSALVDYELDKSTVTDCAAGEVYASLLLSKRDPNTGKTEPFMSNPARRLFEEACRMDPVLRSAQRPVRHL